MNNEIFMEIANDYTGCAYCEGNSLASHLSDAADRINELVKLYDAAKDTIAALENALDHMTRDRDYFRNLVAKEMADLEP